MTTYAQRREQLESHLEEFRRIAEHRQEEKVTKWGYHLPALLSTIIILCQLANTIIFATFAYNFGALYVLLDEYMLETDRMNATAPNSTQVYRYEGVNQERISEIDTYHDQLWTLFVAEVIELVFPTINVCMFGWIVQDKKRRLPTRIQIIYLLCPALALVLSVSQACMIHVTLAEQIYNIRFILAKLLNSLLEVNKKGRLHLEAFFDCEFFNDDDIVKPPCAGQLHDTVVSKSSLTVLTVIHVLPVIAFVYLLVKNLTADRTEHLFLYIESVEQGKLHEAPPALLHDDENRSLRHTIGELLDKFHAKFMPKKAFHDQLVQMRKRQKHPLQLPHCVKRHSSTDDSSGSVSSGSTSAHNTHHDGSGGVVEKVQMKEMRNQKTGF